MRLLSLFACLSQAVALAACATLPEFDETEVETGEVIRNIKCELIEAIGMSSGRHAWLKEWNAGFILTLNVAHKGGVQVDSTLTHPFSPARFLVPVGLSTSGEAQRTEKINFTEVLKALNSPRDLGCRAHEGEPSRYAMLGGRIGFSDLLDRAQSSMREAHIQPTQLDYTINFRIIASANASAKFELVPLGRNSLGASLKWDGSREHSHNLAMTLLPNPRPCSFPDLKKQYGECPKVVVNYPLAVPVTKPKDGTKTLGLPGLVDDAALVLQPTVRATGPRAPGVDPAAQDAINDALGRSILQDTLQEIRRRGIDTP